MSLRITVLTLLCAILAGCGRVAAPSPKPAPTDRPAVAPDPSPAPAATPSPTPLATARAPELQPFVGRWEVDVAEVVRRFTKDPTTLERPAGKRWENNGELLDSVAPVLRGFFFDLRPDKSALIVGGGNAWQTTWTVTDGVVGFENIPRFEDFKVHGRDGALMLTFPSVSDNLPLRRVPKPDKPFDPTGTWKTDKAATLKAMQALWADVLEALPPDIRQRQSDSIADTPSLMKEAGVVLRFHDGVCTMTIQDEAATDEADLEYRVFDDFVLMRPKNEKNRSHDAADGSAEAFSAFRFVDGALQNRLGNWIDALTRTPATAPAPK